MQSETQIKAIEQQVNQVLANEPTHFLVDVRIKPTNNVKVFIDGDKGIPLSSLIDYNRKLYRALEESGMFPNDDFSLEVSSPGLDEPLKMKRQYKKNEGRFVEVIMKDQSKVEGKLVRVSEDSVEVETETGKGKKKEVKQERILFDDILKTKIQIKF
ncbi:MAG TPA: ribosome maturation factor [Chitinophagaceae bacterium]